MSGEGDPNNAGERQMVQTDGFVLPSRQQSEESMRNAMKRYEAKYRGEEPTTNSFVNWIRTFLMLNRGK